MHESERQAAALEGYVAAGTHTAHTYGEQWGMDEAHRVQLVSEWILPAARRSRTALEIGVGGGRWVPYYAEHVERAYLVDATAAAAKAVMARCCGPFEFVISLDGQLPSIPDASVDWAWSFDTFVHFHEPLFSDYLQEVARVLRPGGLLHLHYAVAWPGLGHNAVCFQYRDQGELEALLRGLRMHATGRQLEFRCGFGSLLQEWRRG